MLCAVARGRSARGFGKLDWTVAGLDTAMGDASDSAMRFVRRVDSLGWLFGSELDTAETVASRGRVKLAEGVGVALAISESADALGVLLPALADCR